jgi:hypothetical protein
MNDPVLITCPCCGYKNITGAFDICDICFWEHDKQMEARPDEAGGANGISFREAQRNFARFGAIDEVSLENVRKPTPQDVRDPNWKPLEPLK